MINLLNSPYAYATILMATAIGPFLLSFHPHLYYYRKIPLVMVSSLPVAAVFLVHDVVFTDNSIWGFTEGLNLGVKIGGVPVEEISFFFLVPFACIFIYEAVLFHLPLFNFSVISRNLIFAIASVSLVTSVIFFPLTYTASSAIMCLIFISLCIVFYRQSGAMIRRSPFWLAILFSFGGFFFTNSLLTGLAGPIVVWYSDLDTTGVRMGTIPIEDLGYNFALLGSYFLSYEIFKRRRARNKARSITIIGAGLGGLASAIRLARYGYKVSVYDANPLAGGKANQKIVETTAGTFRFDTGPSLLTLPWTLEQLEKDTGADLGLNIFRLERLCHYFFSDGQELTIPADKDLFAREMSRLPQSSESELKKVLASSSRTYQRSATVFLNHSPWDLKLYLKASTWLQLARFPLSLAVKSYDQWAKKSIKSPYLRKIFLRYATYNGSAPTKTPATFSLIAHVEHELGAHYPEGGIYAIVSALYKECLKQGVEFYLNHRCVALTCEDKSSPRITLAKFIDAQGTLSSVEVDALFSNIDIRSFYRNLAPQGYQQITNADPSSAALVFLWAVDGQHPQLDIHNIFFSEDYDREHTEIFDQQKPPADPTIYINITSKYCQKDAPAGFENWFVMLNMPAGVKLSEAEIALYREAILERVSQQLGTEKPRIINESVMDKPYFIDRYLSMDGALYGQASHGFIKSFFRPRNKDLLLENLYHVGGSVHPGGGIPLALQSAKIATDLFLSKN